MEKTGKGRKITSRIIIGVAVTLALVYVVFLFVTTNFLGSGNIVTETANRVTVYETIKSTALVVRDEEYIGNSDSGILVFNVSDGDKVTADGVIADVYSDSDDVVNMQKIAAIEDKIAYLEELNSLSSKVNVALDSVNNQLNEKLRSLLLAVNRRDFNNISSENDELMLSIYQKQMVTGEQNGFDDKIAELAVEKRELSENNPTPKGSLSSPYSGYFVSSEDGYENVFDLKSGSADNGVTKFDPSKLKNVTYKDFKSAKPESVSEDKYVGKIIRGVNWYLLCPITPDEAVSISHSSVDVSIRLPYAVSFDIPARVYAVNHFSDEEKAMLVLECKYMNEALSKIRNESVEVVINEHEGLKISKSALHDDYIKSDDDKGSGKKTQGVYVKYGNELIFKQVAIIYSDEDYVICDESPDSSLLINGSTVSLYDEIVIQGSDLYNGKLIE